MTTSSRLHFIEQRLNKLEQSLDVENYINALNLHYCSLQKAFKQFVIGESLDHDSYHRLERAIRLIHNRLDELEQNMLKLFFYGEQKKD